MHTQGLAEVSRRDSASPASTHSYAGSPEKIHSENYLLVMFQEKMMQNFPTHLGLLPSHRSASRTPSPVTIVPGAQSPSGQSGLDLRQAASAALVLPQKLVIDESHQGNMVESSGIHSDSDYHSTHRDSASPGAESSNSEHDSGNSTVEISGVRNHSSSDESDKVSPKCGLTTAAQKRCRNTSPNLTKIEEVINNLTSKRKEKRSSPSQDVEGSSHVHKKFKYNNFLSAPSLVHGGLPFSVPPMNLSMGIGGYPYPATSQAAVGLPSASLPPTQVTPPPASSDAAVAASSELTRSGNFDSANSSQSDANNSNSSSPLNLSGGFHISSTPANNNPSYPKVAPPSAKCVRSLLKNDDMQPINLTIRSPASDYSSGRGSRAGSLTPEPAFCKPAPSKEDAKQLKEEMNEQHAKLYTKLKASGSSAVIQLLQQYMSDVDAMETDRFRALAANVASQQLKEAIHIYYDKERKQLCGNVQKKYGDILAEEAVVKKEPSGSASHNPLEAMQQMTHNAAMAQTLANMAAMHQGFPGHHLYPNMMFPGGLPQPGLFPGFQGTGFPGPLPGLSFPSGLPVPSHFLGASEVKTPKQENQQTQQNYSTPHDTSPDSCDDSFSSGSLKRKFLTPTAIEVLSDWYEANKGHPYPDESTVEELGQKANVTTNQKFLQAADFLQNVVYINLNLSEDEKMQRYSTLSMLYGQLGMHRKSSFFRRVAAMQCVAPTHPKPQWQQCYSLLIRGLEGYKLSLDPKHYPHDRPHGWPLVQLRVLHELIYSARRMGQPLIAVRHLTLLLHTMFGHLTLEERREMVNVLESYTSQQEATPQVLAVDNGTILPPVPFYRFPTVKTFKPQNLPPHLRPIKLKTDKDASLNVKGSPFIYSPIQSHAAKQKVPGSKMDFQWSVGDVCEVAMTVHNPMPFELKVSNVSLLCEGVDYECYPTSLSLPAESGPFPVKVMGTPKSTGRLTIHGYTATALGVRSHCKLRDIPHLPDNKFEIDIVDRLPQISLATSLAKAASFTSVGDSACVVNSATTCLYAGQSEECQVTISNTGKEPVERIEILLDSKLQPDLLKKVFVWNKENLDSQLPLQPGCQACFTLYIHGASDYLPLSQSEMPFSPRSKSLRMFGDEVSESTSIDGEEAVIIESLLKVQYSGGRGMEGGSCRQCAVAFTVEILPSLVFHKWNVIPAKSCDKCQLEFDVQNATDHELRVEYSTSDSVALSAGQCKRFTMEIGRSRLPDPPKLPPVGHAARGPYSSQAVVAQDTYSQHVANYVDIRWTLPTLPLSGKASIERLRWSKEQLELIQLPPVLWDVEINDEVTFQSPSAVCSIGDTFSLCCRLTNNSECDITSAHLSAIVFSDLLTGCQGNSDDDIITIGPVSTSISEISNGSSAKHEVGFVFLSAGLYKVDISCTGHTSQLISTPFACHSSKSQSVTGQDTNTFTTGYANTWRHSPPLHIEVKALPDAT